MGNTHLRQVRVKKNSCHVASSVEQYERDCHAPYSWEVEDTGSYGPGWSQAVGDNASQTLEGPWMYQSQSKLRAYPIWGSMMLYRGGGFMVDLGSDLQNSSRWVFIYSRATESEHQPVAALRVSSHIIIMYPDK